tara:strand:- start:1322 stop:1591 length:270 start_codon:yes stop_codon:yes gene_type:complete
MPEKKTTKKAAPKKAAEKKAEAPKPGRPPKVAEVTELDLGPKLISLINTAADDLGVDRAVIVRALVRRCGHDLRRIGPIGVRMALKRYL